MRWTEITNDGTFKLTARFTMDNLITVYIAGDNPNGSFEFGIGDKKQQFAPIPEGIQDQSFATQVGKGVALFVRVTGYAGTSTNIGITGE